MTARECAAIEYPPLVMAISSAPDSGSKRFHVMVKPGGAHCNLDCSYCFYLHKQESLRQPELPRMADHVLEAHIRQYIQAQKGAIAVFSWQGGEPTLMGLEFFRRVIELQSKHVCPGQVIENDLQTNGILLNEEWMSFLKEHNFLVGLSVDGPPDLHDLHRRAKGGAPTAARVERAARLMHEHDIDFNALCVVSRTNARRPIDVYRYLRDKIKPRMIQFIPCVERKEYMQTAPGFRAETSTAESISDMVTEWSVLPQDWGYFLERIWREWIKRDYGVVFVDQFENVISQMFGYGAQKCITSEQCGRGLALEHNGDLFSCDHFVYPEYRLGNILESSESELLNSDRQQAFGEAKSARLNAACRSCEFLTLCWGDCPKTRFGRSPQENTGISFLCSGLKRFFTVATLSKRELSKRLVTPST